MGASSSKKYLVFRENTSRVLTRDQIPTYQNYKAKKTKSQSQIVQTHGGNHITVDGAPNIGYNGDYDLYLLNDGQFYYKHINSPRYIYKSKHNAWFISKVLNSANPKYWTREATPDPTIPTAWFSWDYGNSVQLGENFKIQRFFKIDPPTPRTQSRLEAKSSKESISTQSEKILIFPAFSVMPCWEDKEFNVFKTGPNNFQDASNKTLRVHLNMNNWTWSTQWDGPIFYPVNDFFTKWQNRDFIVKMPFVSTNYGVNVHDIQQGNVGDCWFLSSVMTVVNFRNGLIEKVICLKENQSQENGRYKFKFYHFDQWKEVIVDGHLPMCGTARSAYYSTAKDLFDRFHQKPTDDNQETDYWVPLLEKAFAKYCGSYKNLVAGHPTRGLGYITGGLAIRMVLDKSTISNFEKKKYNFFTYLLNNCDRICCCTSTNFKPSTMNIQHEVVADSGLVYNHAYSLLEARAVENKKGRQINLLRIRNPWNRRTNLRLKAEWNGDWSAKSRLWKSLESQVSDSMSQSEGEFWISERDWLKHFRVIDICYPPAYFEKYSHIDFRYAREVGINAEKWSLGSHARHYKPSENYPVSKLVELNENEGYSTHNFWLEGGCAEVFVQNLTDCTYVQRLTWIRKGFKNQVLIPSEYFYLYTEQWLFSMKQIMSI